MLQYSGRATEGSTAEITEQGNHARVIRMIRCMVLLGNGTEGKSDVLLTTGDYPAVMGFDLGKLELDSKENLDGVPFDRMRKEIIAQYERGGIVTLSWHPWNPATGENAWDPKGDAVAAVLDGGAQQQKFDFWIKKVSDFILSLKTNDGKLIPVIFRPWHEMNGGWFWWGANSCTPAQYNQLYANTYHRLTKAGCSNIVWAMVAKSRKREDRRSFLGAFPRRTVCRYGGHRYL